MNGRNFFIGRGVVFGVLIILGLGIFFYKTIEDSPENKQTAPVAMTQTPPVFTWKYENDETLNLDGLPQTNVYLEAVYEGKIMSKLIATVPGGCNDLPEKENDSALNSSVAQCYAAGYGDLFKVIKGEQSYLVMRKVFEEGSPDYTPSVQEYSVVVEFPFSIEK